MRIISINFKNINILRMKKTEMVESLINFYEGGNKSQFAKRLGLRPQTISSWVKRGSLDAEIVYAKCEGVSADWLLSCEGEMLRYKQNADDINAELLTLCKSIVDNYKQRDELMGKLESVLKLLEG